MAATLSLAAAAPAELHLLPCTIEHSGEAQVSAYFRPTPTGSTAEGEEVLEASFRGRKLEGARLQLPEGYSGLVLERQQVEGDPAEAPTTRWVPTASFAELTYWNHDSVPARGDGTRRCLEWAQLAAQLHQPLSPSELQADTPQ